MMRQPGLLRWLPLLWLLSRGLVALAQPTGPAGRVGPPLLGQPPRQVQELERVPLPPGGLIPFRQGAYWGYADTTGRVVIQPVLEPEPPFFVGDVVQLGGRHLPQFRDPHNRDYFNGRNLPYALPQYQSYVFWLNARGEFLAVDTHGREPEAALVLSGGRLRAGRVAEHLGEPALTMPYNAAPQVQPVPPPRPPSSSEVIPWPPAMAAPPPSPYVSVGEGRFMYAPVKRHYQLVTVARRRSGRNGHYRYYHAYRFFVPHQEASPAALVDSAGRPLTAFTYYWTPGAQLQSGWLVVSNAQRFQRAPNPPDYACGLLNRRGRELPLPPNVQRVELGADGLALVWSLNDRETSTGHKVTDLGGIIDTAGRWLLPMTGRLSGPDAYGYRRHAALVNGDSVTRFITRRAEPAFATNTFRYAGTFYNGRAWVEALDGRQGLINRRGEWVTPLRYELLALPVGPLVDPRRPYQQRADISPLRPFLHYDPRITPDTAYMLCRRAGKYGYVARRSGREAIPARYDSVRYHLTNGLACLYRGGQPYVVNSRGRELARAEFRGDWYGYPGRPLQVYRPADGRWSVVDTSGRQRLPWLPGTGYLTPDGRAVVREPVRVAGQARPDIPVGQPCSGVVDSLGRVVVSFRKLVGYVGPLPHLYMNSLRNSRYDDNYRWPYLDSVAGPGSGGYVVGDEATGAQRLLRARDLQPLLAEAFSPERPPDTEAGPAGVKGLPGGWCAGRRLADGRSVLVSPAGRQHVAPPGTGWHLEYFSQSYNAPTVPFRHGVEKVRWGRGMFGPEDQLKQGYVTPGGRPLWAD